MSPLDAVPTYRGCPRKRLGIAGIATVVALLLTACSGPASTGAGGVGGSSENIQVGLSYTLSTGFDPMTASGATPLAINTHIFEALVELDPATREPYPALAAEMPEQIDPTTLRVKLREGATFHNDSPITAEDVVFSFERVLDPANSSLFAQFVPFVERVEAVDEGTVEIKLAYPFALAAERLSVVKIVPRDAVENDAKKFDANPVGSGPYRLVEATADDKIVLEQFDGYNGDHPAKEETLTFRLLSDPSARVTALESGRVQAIEDVPYIDVERLSNAAKVESVQSFGLLFMMFNTDIEPFDDKRVRQALHYAIDREKLIETAMLGQAEPATSYVQQTHPDYAEAGTVYTYDPDKSKALLEEAGVNNLKLKLVATDTGWVKDAVPVIKENFDAIGVRTTLDIGQSGGQYENKIDTGKYQVMVAPGDPSVFGNDLDLLLRWYYDGVWPETRYNWSDTAQGKKVVSLMDEAVRTADSAERAAIWQQVIDIVAEEAPIYPILHRKLPTAWNGDALTGFEPLSTTGLSLLDVGRS